MFVLNPNSRLTIQYFNASSYLDASLKLQDFTKDDLEVSITGVRTLWVGYYKPITQFYIDFTTPGTNSTLITSIKYNNGSETSVSNLLDYTQALTRSGNLKWSAATDEVKSTVNGVELYWYKVNMSGTQTTSNINGVTILFSDDQDLAEYIPDINDSEHLTGKPSHVLAHIVARNWIVQDLRNKSYGKVDAEGVIQDITAWDLLDIDQINQAATFKALSVIYFNYSDEPADIYEIKSKSFEKKAREAMSLAKLKIDFNDDGLKNDAENDIEYKTRRVTR